jgi:hypothetical protein
MLLGFLGLGGMCLIGSFGMADARSKARLQEGETALAAGDFEKAFDYAEKAKENPKAAGEVSALEARVLDGAVAVAAAAENSGDALRASDLYQFVQAHRPSNETASKITALQQKAAEQKRLRDEKAKKDAEEAGKRQAQAEAERRRQEAEKNKPANMNEEIKFDDSVWVVKSAELCGKTMASNNTFQKGATTEGKFVRVQFSVKNLQNKQDSIMDHPKLMDSQGREFGLYDHASFYVPKGTKTMVLEQLPPSMTKEYWAVYEVPDDSTGIRFKARSLSAFGATKLVDLGF